MSDSPNLDPLLGKVLEERYRVDELIARGGMATVYRGTDLRLGRTVALKVLGGVLANDPDFVERFTQEARATAALTHPNVVAVHDQGISAGFPFLVMEFVQGRTIREVMAQSGPFTSAHALEIISSVLAGLGSAHDAGFVHRDIKPENVLITNDGHIKVTDFGLARVISDTPVSDSTGAVLLGTMAYLSPEQVQQLAVDQRSDVYSCGILLYEMVTGLVPFTGSSPLEVAYQHVNSNVYAPSSVQPDVPPAVDHLVLAATRKLPLERIQSAREFRDAVIRAISAVPRAEALVAVLSIQASQVVSTPSTEVHREMQRPAPVQESKPGINTTGDESTNERSKLRGRLAPLIMILALLVGGGAWYQYSGTYEVVQQVDVPPIVGTLITDATTTLTALGLTTKTIQEDFDDSFAGTILSTDPVPGTSVPKGTVINVVLSKGPVLIDVPNVVGMGLQDALFLLETEGIKVQIIGVGTVKRQSVAPGASSKSNKYITIELS